MISSVNVVCMWKVSRKVSKMDSRRIISCLNFYSRQVILCPLLGYRHISLNTGYAHLPDSSARLFVKVEFERHEDPKILKKQ